MKFEIQRNEFLKGLQKIQNIVEKRTTMPILSYILIEVHSDKIVLTGTNLETSLKVAYKARVTKEGNTVLSARTLFEIVRSMTDDQILLEKKEDHEVYIFHSNGKYTIFELAASEFPTFPPYEHMHFINIPCDTLKDMIEKTIHSIAGEELRYNLAGVYVEKMKEETRLRFVSTDGHKLSIIDKSVDRVGDINIAKGVIIPKRGVYEINRVVDKEGVVDLGMDESVMVVKKDEMILAVRLLSGEFPDYGGIIARQNDKKVRISKGGLRGALARVGLLTSERYRGLRFRFVKGKMDVSIENPDVGRASEEVGMDYSGPDLEIAFNPRYFIETLDSMRSNEIDLALGGSSDPCIITGPEDQGFLGLIMPMVLKG